MDLPGMTKEELDAAIEEAVRKRLRPLRLGRAALMAALLIQLVVTLSADRRAHEWEAMAQKSEAAAMRALAVAQKCADIQTAPISTRKAE
jgi:hypothetical protein